MRGKKHNYAEAIEAFSEGKCELNTEMYKRTLKERNKIILQENIIPAAVALAIVLIFHGC